MSAPPRLRPGLQPIFHRHQGVPLVVIDDPSGLGEPLIADLQQWVLLSLIDGQRERPAILAAYPARCREMLPAQLAEGLIGGPLATVLAGLINALDGKLLLDNDRAARAARERREAFLAAPVREAAFAGSAYPCDAAELRRWLDQVYRDGPGALPAPGSDPDAPRAICAPHIDLRLAAPTYAHAWRALAAGPVPARVLILGIAHRGADDVPFTLTRKAFATPLGELPTDGDFIDRLVAACPDRDLFRDELTHRREHSIEFQLPFIQHAYGEQAPPIVPLLCGPQLACLQAGALPPDDPETREVLAALREVIQASPGHTAIVASVDLSHVGPKFGDERPADAAFLAEVEASDRALVDRVVAGEPDAFWRQLAAQHNNTHICGYPAIDTLLRLLGPGRGELLDYGIAPEAPTQSAVTYAAISYRRGE